MEFPKELRFKVNNIVGTEDITIAGVGISRCKDNRITL